jgi:DNA-binding NarL/FixJ family response regulator
MKRAPGRTTTEAAIRELVAQGMKFPAVAEKLNVNVFALRATCSLLGIKSPVAPPKPPSTNNRAKVAHRAEEIAARVANGELLLHIANEIGVSHSTLHHLLRRRGFATTPKKAEEA